MKQKHRVFEDISTCKMKELFVPSLVHFLCTFCILSLSLSPSLRELFLREKCFYPVKIKCLGQAPTILRK